MGLGERIRFIRGKLSLERFGEILSKNSKNVKFDSGHLSKFEREVVYPSYNFFLALSEAFDVDMNWVITGQGLEYKTDPMDYKSEAKKLTKYFKKAE